jgi:hypothetical protein
VPNTVPLVLSWEVYVDSWSKLGQYFGSVSVSNRTGAIAIRIRSSGQSSETQTNGYAQNDNDTQKQLH